MIEVRNLSEFKLESHEVIAAMREFLEQKKELHKAMIVYVEKNRAGSEVSKVKIDKGEKDVVPEVSVTIGRGENKSPLLFQNGTALELPNGYKRSQYGFKRKNLGMYDTLTEYLHKQKKVHNKKTIPFDVVFNYIIKQYPDLTDRKFMIYSSDKRQQAKRNFKFDGKKRIFIVY